MPTPNDREVPERLFHYTSGAGLLGILESRKLWATEARYLNDAKELEYGLSVIASVVDSLAGSQPKLIAGALRKLAQSLCEEATFYVACFCEADYFLSQWRGYSSRGGDIGYAIGFRRAGLQGVFGTSLERVIYSPAEQKTEIERVLNEALVTVGAFGLGL